MKHTPGPWEFVPKLPGDEDGKIGKANATLIAAAPDMLAALRQAVVVLAGACEHSPDLVLHDAYEAASAAIARAVGLSSN